MRISMMQIAKRAGGASTHSEEGLWPAAVNSASATLVLSLLAVAKQDAQDRPRPPLSSKRARVQSGRRPGQVLKQ
jgi:hypothetical protein